MGRSYGLKGHRGMDDPAKLDERRQIDAKALCRVDLRDQDAVGQRGLVAKGERAAMWRI